MSRLHLTNINGQTTNSKDQTAIPTSKIKLQTPKIKDQNTTNLAGAPPRADDVDGHEDGADRVEVLQPGRGAGMGEKIRDQTTKIDENTLAHLLVF